MTSLVAQSSDLGEGVGATFIVIWIAVVVFYIASWWIVFTKAGHPGWAAIIPIYNFVVLLKIAQRPVWWIVLLLIPLVNIVVLIIVSIEVAQNFGKTTGFGVGLALLGWIFYPILAFGSARYQPPGAAGVPAPPLWAPLPPPPPPPTPS